MIILAEILFMIWNRIFIHSFILLNQSMCSENVKIFRFSFYNCNMREKLEIFQFSNWIFWRVLLFPICVPRCGIYTNLSHDIDRSGHTRFVGDNKIISITPHIQHCGLTVCTRPYICANISGLANEKPFKSKRSLGSEDKNELFRRFVCGRILNCTVS